MSKANSFLSSNQVRIIAVAATVLAWLFSASSATPLAGVRVWLIVLFIVFSIFALAVSWMMRGAASSASTSTKSKARHLSMDENDRLHREFYAYEQDAEDDRCDASGFSGDSGSSGCDSSSD